MITFDLQCMDCTQSFEAWFESYASFEEQKQKDMLSCPICDSYHVQKQLSTPMLPKKANQKAEKKAKTEPQDIQTIIKDFRRYIQDNFENVGDQFAQESRKIYYGEADERNIYGKASVKEIEELNSEGVDVLPLPNIKNKH